MVKRCYFPNQEIKIGKQIISIATGGTAYLKDGGTMRKLDSLFFPKSNVLAVDLDGKEIRIRPTKNGLKIAEAGKL